MSLLQQLESMPLDKRVQFYYEKAIQQKLNYYQMLEVTPTSTQRDIETAHARFVRLFPTVQLSQLPNEQLREWMGTIVRRLQYAIQTLSDFQKRGEYEKRGFKEADEVEDQKDNPIEQAKIIYRKAKTLQMQKDYSKAIMAIKEAIKLDPDTASYYLMLGMCQSEVPMYRREAEPNLLKASELESWNAEPLVALGMLFYNERLMNRAEGYFRKALELENNHPVARRKLSEIAVPEKKSILSILKPLFAPLRKILATIMPTFFKDSKK